MNRFLILLIIAICFPGFLSFNPSHDHLARGRVLSDSIQIPFARVRIPASDNYVLTDNNGEFEINLPDHSDSLVITAAAKGYYNGAKKVSSDDKSITINLHRLFSKDNPDYKWTDPEINPESRGNCGNCHPCNAEGRMGKKLSCNLS